MQLEHVRWHHGGVTDDFVNELLPNEEPPGEALADSFLDDVWTPVWSSSAVKVVKQVRAIMNEEVVSEFVKDREASPRLGGGL